MVMTVIKCFLGFKKTNKDQKEVFQIDSTKCESELNLKATQNWCQYSRQTISQKILSA